MVVLTASPEAPAPPCGVLVIDKEPGPSSFDVVRRLRAMLRVRRAGHGGTLDGMASGVLPVCLGEATKLAQFLLDADKEYEATVRLGVETDTGDAEGRQVSEHPTGDIDEARVREALGPFRGDIMQVPPVYSALKRAGRPLYSYARAGEAVELEPRAVRIDELELTSWQGPEAFTLHVRCSKGTYIRSLAVDLGRALGCGGHLTALRRTRSGPFGIGAALRLDAVSDLIERGEPVPLIRPAEVLAHLPAIVVDEAAEAAVRQGKRIPVEIPVEVAEGGQLRLLRPDGILVAVAEAREGSTAAPVRVWNSA